MVNRDWRFRCQPRGSRRSQRTIETGPDPAPEPSQPGSESRLEDTGQDAIGSNGRVAEPGTQMSNDECRMTNAIRNSNACRPWFPVGFGLELGSASLISKSCCLKRNRSSPRATSAERENRWWVGRDSNPGPTARADGALWLCAWLW